MGEIRVVGRARGGRCVYCHDTLAGDVARCPECRAAWHRECGAEATRCPTIACPGPAPGAEVARRRGGQRATRVRAATAPAPSGLRDPRVPAWTVGRGRPGLAARLGPYSRLVVSGAFNAAVFLLVAGLVLYALTHPAETWKVLSTGKRGAHEPAAFAVLKGCVFSLMLGTGLLVTGSWLRRLPASALETRHLLESTAPVLMYLTTFTTGSGKHARRWARLRGKHGEHAGQVHELRLDGILPPWWLTSRSWAEEPVLVYGLPPPGPYVLEFEDGLLALVHPDEETSRRGR